MKTHQETSVIKVARKALHNTSMAVINGMQVGVQEDIIKETAILRYLTSNKPPKTLAKFEHFFSDKSNYYLVMEDGGSCFFDFVKKCHEFIHNGRLSMVEWHRFCKLAFKQIVDLIDWLHNEMNTVHLDLSLENFVINDVMVTIQEETGKVLFSGDFVIKLIDFGLAEVFTSRNSNNDIDFQCTKFVGKTAYKTPTIYARRRPFDARSADCWSLGVVLFTMLTGGAPYKKPSKKDVTFRYIVRGKIMDLLKCWNRTQYVTLSMVNLMDGIFQKEKYRLNIGEIKNHPWLK